MFDYLIVGAGLYGAVVAQQVKEAGKSVLVIERRPHIAGNVYTEDVEGIHVHKYGAHIFHTNNKEVWDFVNSIVEFNRYTNSPIANYKGKQYNLPFNMNTFCQMWGVLTPEEAKSKIEEQKADAVVTMKAAGVSEPRNLEEQALMLIGRDIYETLIKGYTEKQWGRSCTDLPAFIIKRLPVRFVHDNNYFNDRYQGIPIGGYNKLIDGLLDGVETMTGVDFIEERKKSNSPFFILCSQFEKIVYTGAIDEYFDYKFGKLEWRTVSFEEEVLNTPNYQGNAVMNYTEREVPYTRIIEHKHFEFGSQPITIISREYPLEWKPGDEPYYPVNDEKNNTLYERYRERAKEDKNVLFGGRLGHYKYYDMDKVIEAALTLVEEEF